MEVKSVGPKLHHQEAKLHDLVVKQTSAGSRSRLLAIEVQVLAGLGERVRGLA